jgi:hypothetical protein
VLVHLAVGAIYFVGEARAFFLVRRGGWGLGSNGSLDSACTISARKQQPALSSRPQPPDVRARSHRWSGNLFENKSLWSIENLAVDTRHVLRRCAPPPLACCDRIQYSYSCTVLLNCTALYSILVCTKYRRLVRVLQLASRAPAIIRTIQVCTDLNTSLHGLARGRTTFEHPLSHLLDL